MERADTDGFALGHQLGMCGYLAVPQRITIHVVTGPGGHVWSRITGNTIENLRDVSFTLPSTLQHQGP